MKPIHKDEIFQHVNDFLKTRGFEVKEGSYAKGIHAGCSLLADAINLSQQGFERAKTEMEQKLEQMRQVIHEKTAPKPPPPQPVPTPAAQPQTGNVPGTASSGKTAQPKAKQGGRRKAKSPGRRRRPGKSK